MSCVMCHVSCVMFHVSYVTCNLSHVTCHISPGPCHLTPVTKPTTTATDPPLDTSPFMYSRLEWIKLKELKKKDLEKNFLHFFVSFRKSWIRDRKMNFPPTIKEPKNIHALAATSAFNLKLCPNSSHTRFIGVFQYV